MEEKSKDAIHNPNQELIEIKLFKKSVYFKALEQASLMGEDMIIRDASNGKFDLDSDSG